jgi:hypothetical protein
MKYKINIKKRNFSLKIEDKCVSFTLNWSKRKLNKNYNSSGIFSKKYIDKRYLWINYSNKKEQVRVWGKESCESKYHFCIVIPGVITLDTAHVGKQLFNSRINLTQFFKKDYKVYTSSEEVQSC